MANEGAAELSFRAIQDVLQGIRVENGYRHTVKTVYRTFEPMLMESLSGLGSPSLALGRTPGADAQYGLNDDAGYEVTMPATIVGYMRRGAENAEDDEASTRAEAFISDITKALMADPCFGTLRGQLGHITEHKIVATDHGAAWDDSGIFIEIRFEYAFMIDGVNP
ncbi:MAG: hypothetical protein L0099_02660 [Acidobacteria bacterium]|nr:hypothetical protein [Acidobacteriota bacterium]